MLGGHLCLSNIETLFLSPSNPLGNKISSYKALLHQPLLTERVAQRLVLLSLYDIGLKTLKAVKSLAIGDLLT